MPITSKEALFDVVTAMAPAACCDASHQCCAGIEDWSIKAEELPDCKQDPTKKAAPEPFHVRLGRDPDRTSSPNRGGGPKVWHPDRETWFALATLGQELEGVTLEKGTYRLLFGDAKGRPLRGQVGTLPTVQYEPREAAAATTGNQLRRQMMKEVHDSLLERTRIENAAIESHAASAREALRVANEVLEKHTELLAKTRENLEHINKLQKDITENIGGMAQTQNITLKAQAEGVMNAKPQLPLSIMLLQEGKELLKELRATKALEHIREMDRAESEKRPKLPSKKRTKKATEPDKGES